MSLACTHSSLTLNPWPCGTRCNGSGCLVTINVALIRAVGGELGEGEQRLANLANQQYQQQSHTENLPSWMPLYGRQTRAGH